MPELPEVETVCAGLEPAVDGARIENAKINRPNLRFPFPNDFENRLIGQRVVSLSRRAKYLLWHLEDGTIMIVHLGMSGSFRVEDIESGDVNLVGETQFAHERSKRAKHDHVELWMRQEDGARYKVTYNDPRRFGFMLFQERGEEQHPMLERLGIEPTGNRLGGTILAELFKTKKAPLKAALLDQSLVAGLGNIYVCEALWRSGLSPTRSAQSVATKTGKSTQKSNILANAIRDVIREAIEAGGSSLRDHRQTDGEMGYFQHNFAVYDQEGSDCKKEGCKGVIERIVQSGRSTFYCPKCQK